jgi:uncharacterized protein
LPLKLAPGLELPDEAVTQTFGVLAKRGAGKSNAGAVMAEEMYRAHLPFVYTDRVQIRRRETFDSGATPTVKATRAVATLADVDLGAITEQMTATIEKAKAEDPRELHRRIRELEKKLRASESQVVTAAPEPTIEYRDVPVLSDAQFAALEKMFNDSMALEERVKDVIEGWWERWAAPMVEITEASAEMHDAMVSLRSAGISDRIKQTSNTPTKSQVTARPRGSDSSPSSEAPKTDPVGLGKGERTVLGVLRQWPDGRTNNELAFLAGYSAKASTLGVILSKLRQLGYVGPGQPVRLTAEGLDAAGGYEPLPAGDELLNHWRRHPRMGEGERRVLDVLVEQYPNDLSNAELCDLTGYSPTASTMGVILSKLRKLGLVEKGVRRLAPEFAEAIGR